MFPPAGISTSIRMHVFFIFIIIIIIIIIIR